MFLSKLVGTFKDRFSRDGVHIALSCLSRMMPLKRSFMRTFQKSLLTTSSYKNVAICIDTLTLLLEHNIYGINKYEAIIATEKGTQILDHDKVTRDSVQNLGYCALEELVEQVLTVVFTSTIHTSMLYSK